MKDKIYYCNTCNKGIKEKDMNDNEYEEMSENKKYFGVPSFVCSDCINKEMMGK